MDFTTHYYRVYYTQFPGGIAQTLSALVKAFTAADVRVQFEIHMNCFGDSKGPVRYVVHSITPVSSEKELRDLSRTDVMI